MTTAEPAAAYRETLRAPASWYFIGFLFGLALACILLWFGPWQSLTGLIGGTVLCGWGVFSYSRITIEVRGDVLTAGPASLPLASLGEARALDAEGARALRMHEADPRAFMLLRSYVRTAVRVEVLDPADPHPYLYLSSRHPERLAAALTRASAAAR